MSGPAGATIHLYCDNPNAAPEKFNAPPGVHEFKEFPHEITDPESVSKARTRARKAGWHLSRDGEHDLCPKCNPRSPYNQRRRANDAIHGVISEAADRIYGGANE